MKKELFSTPIQENLPLVESDMETLLDEENTRFYSLLKEYESSTLSTRTMIYLGRFMNALTGTFGEEWHELALSIQGRIPNLVHKIREGKDAENAEERIAFLVGLYGRINHSLKDRDMW